MKLAPSSAQRKEEPVSLELNANVAPVEFVGFVGLAVIVTVGAVVSIVQL